MAFLVWIHPTFQHLPDVKFTFYHTSWTYRLLSKKGDGRVYGPTVSALNCAEYNSRTILQPRKTLDLTLIQYNIFSIQHVTEYKWGMFKHTWENLWQILMTIALCARPVHWTMQLSYLAFLFVSGKPLVRLSRWRSDNVTRYYLSFAQSFQVNAAIEPYNRPWSLPHSFQFTIHNYPIIRRQPIKICSWESVV